MPNWKKIFIGTGIGASVIGLIAYVSKLKRVGDKLEAIATANIHSLLPTGLTIRVDVTLKNPTEGTLKINYPFVKIIHEKKEVKDKKEVVTRDVIGTSKAISKTITIPKFGEAKITEIMISVPTTKLLSIGGALANLLLKKQAVNISVETLTSIDLGWKKVPYEKKDDITLQPKAQK